MSQPSNRTESPTIGFIGLGLMGAPMAAVMSSGLTTVGYDVARKPGEDIGRVRILASIEAVTAAADIVCLSLPTPEASIGVTSEITQSRSSRVKVIAELSTIGMQAVETCSRIAEAAGIGYVDAPVSGGVARAATGKLSIMAAGRDEAISVARPALEQISGRVFIMGDRPGLGQVMKMANNIIGATSLAITSEAVVFGTRLGLKIEKMIEVINASTGRTETSEVKFPNSIIPRTFKQGARSAIMRKDVRLYVDDANATGMPLLLAAATDRIWEEFYRLHADEDFSLIYKYIEDMAGPFTDTTDESAKP